MGGPPENKSSICKTPETWPNEMTHLNRRMGPPVNMPTIAIGTTFIDIL
jgi:hypothetical protein